MSISTSLADSQDGNFAPCIHGHGINSSTDPVQLLQEPFCGKGMFKIHNYCNIFSAVLCSSCIFYLQVSFAV